MIMKKNIVLLCTILMSMCSSWATEKGRFVLTGQLTRDSLRFTPAVVQKLYLAQLIDGEEVRIDSVIVKNKRFCFKGDVAENAAPYLITGFDNGTIPFFAEEGNITVQPFDAREPFKACVTGTPNNDVLAGYQAVLVRCRQRNDGRVKQLEETVSDDIKADEKVYGAYKKALHAGDSLYTKMEIIKYVKHHLDMPASLYIMNTELFDLFSAKVIDRQLLRSMSKDLYNHPIYVDMSNRMKAMSMKVGSLAPDVTGVTPEGKEVKLSDLKGKYVLLHFWSSQKDTTLNDFSVIKHIMKSSESKDNFAVLSFSVDKDQKEWIDYIEKNQLTHRNWTHAFDSKGLASKAAELFNVQSIPYTVLLNPKGQIIAFDIKGEELQTKATFIITGIEVYE